MASLIDSSVTIERSSRLQTSVRPSSNKSKIFSAPLGGQNTDFIILVYSNRIFITVTQLKKIGNLYLVQLDCPQRNGIITTSGPSVFDIRCILGQESEELLVAVRSLAEKLSLNKPVLFSLSIPPPNFEIVTQIANLLLENRCW